MAIHNELFFCTDNSPSLNSAASPPAFFVDVAFFFTTFSDATHEFFFFTFISALVILSYLYIIRVLFAFVLVSCTAIIVMVSDWTAICFCSLYIPFAR